MDNETLLWILGGMQAVTWGGIGWIKLDINDLWHRANTHGHKIVCDEAGCKPRTDGVILERG